MVTPDEVVKPTNLSEPELRMEFAILMFQQDRLTLGQASEFAGVSQAAFPKVLGSRQILVHYGLDDLEGDLQTGNERRPR